MRLEVHYKAIDPYYQDLDMTYVGQTMEEIMHQKRELEEYMGKEYPGGYTQIRMIDKICKIIEGVKEEIKEEDIIQYV